MMRGEKYEVKGKAIRLLSAKIPECTNSCHGIPNNKKLLSLTVQFTFLVIQLHLLMFRA